MFFVLPIFDGVIMDGHGGILRLGLDGGVPLEPQNPYPSLRVILAEKGTHCQGFFLKNRPIFSQILQFSGSSPCENPKI